METKYLNRSFVVCCFVVFFHVLFSAGLQAEYKSGPAVDVRAFDIAGVKLGMSFSDAVNAVSETYNVKPIDLHVLRLRMGSKVDSPKLPASIRLNSDDSYSVGLGVRTDGWEISIRLDQIVPSPHDESMEVVAIEYEMARTQENIDSLRSTALAKYGEPTLDLHSMGLAWCIKPSTHWATCESEAVLEYSGTRLKLHDSRPYRLKREGQDKRSSSKAKI